MKPDSRNRVAQRFWPRMEEDSIEPGSHRAWIGKLHASELHVNATRIPCILQRTPEIKDRIQSPCIQHSPCPLQVPRHQPAESCKHEIDGDCSDLRGKERGNIHSTENTLADRHQTWISV